MNWSNEDPREHINKLAHIIIVRPDHEGHLQHTGSAFVDSKDTYCIFTSFDDHKHISADEFWDPLWYWIRAPEKKVLPNA